MNRVKPVAQQRPQLIRTRNSARIGRSGEQVESFNELFVHFDEIMVLTRTLLERLRDDFGNRIEADFATNEIVAVNGSQDLLRRGDRQFFGTFPFAHPE